MNSKSTPLHKFLSIISWVILICSLGLLIFLWKYIPHKLPLHSTGMRLEDIDRYGDKIGLIPIILVFIIIYLVLCLLPYFPSEFNVSNNIKDNEKEIINNLTKTKWLILRIEYLIFIVYFTWRIINIQGIGNCIYIYLSLFVHLRLYFLILKQENLNNIKDIAVSYIFSYFHLYKKTFLIYTHLKFFF